MKFKKIILLTCFASLLAFALGSDENGKNIKENLNKKADALYGKIVGEEIAVLTDAPLVPPPITRKTPTKVIVNLEVKELVKEISEGVKYTFWTFGGSVPGKFIRVRVGDFVEFNLNNHPDNKVPHNIDLHAVTGPGGGAEGSFTAPGHTSTFSFRVINPGLYVYHCATAPVGMHIGNGMYGLILVEPEEGMPKVDKEFYVMQGDFYTDGKFGQKGFQNFSMERAIDENPNYVLFNGAVGANTGDKAMQVNVGETMRLYVGNGGPNLTSSFHVIGEIFDKVYIEGGKLINENVQTTMVPPGGSTIVDFKVESEGMLNIVDHALFRTFNKGALAQIKVVGEKNLEIYTSKQNDAVYMPEGAAMTNVKEEVVKKPAKKLTFAEKMEDGKRLFTANCMACHQANGEGIANAFPPLAKSDFLMKDANRAIKIVTKGLSGEITVNGKKFNGIMPPVLNLSDSEIASILTYVRNSWGNKGSEVKDEDVAKIRKQK